MIDRVKKFSVLIDGHRTSVSLEPIFWQQLKLIAKQRDTKVSRLISDIDDGSIGNLSSAIRVFVLRQMIGL